jgi:hypothetical protein
MGCILFLVEKDENSLARFTDLLVGDWAGVKRQFTGPAHDFHGECLLVVGRQRLEGIQELNGSLTHTFKVALFLLSQQVQQVPIAVEVVEPTLESIPGYDEDARIQYTGGLSEDLGGDDTLAE